jgi:hypothetical protein
MGQEVAHLPDAHGSDQWLALHLHSSLSRLMSISIILEIPFDDGTAWV